MIIIGINNNNLYLYYFGGVGVCYCINKGEELQNFLSTDGLQNVTTAKFSPQTITRVNQTPAGVNKMHAL